MNRPSQTYRVSRGHYRTKKETRQLLGLPPGSSVPGRICKLPLFGLLMMAQAAAARIEGRMKAEANPEPVEVTLDATEQERQKAIEERMANWTPALLDESGNPVDTGPQPPREVTVPVVAD